MKSIRYHVNGRVRYQSNTEPHYQLYEPLIRLAHFSNSKTKMEAIDTTMKVILSTLISVTNVITLNLHLLSHMFRYFAARRKRLVKVVLSSSRGGIKRVRKQRAVRRYWEKPGRSNIWWLNLLNGISPVNEWKENLRMSQTNFVKLCDEIRPLITLQTTTMRRPLSPERQLAIMLYYLSDGGRMLKTANAFGCAVPTVSKVVNRVTTAISSHLVEKYISLPKTEAEVQGMAASFYKAFGFPQCIGAIDGTHIPLKKPSKNPVDFINRKGFYSLNVQACVDYSYCFFDVDIRWPGSVHDARVFSNSKINEAMREGMPRCPKTIVHGEDAVPVCILGDPAYPLLPYLLKEFAKGGNTQQEQFFGLGFRLSSTRMVIECPYGRLKARFGILRKPIDIDIKFVPVTVLACFILHNFCEKNNEDVVVNSTFTDTVENCSEFQPITQVSNSHSNESGGKKNRTIFMKFFE